MFEIHTVTQRLEKPQNLPTKPQSRPVLLCSSIIYAPPAIGHTPESVQKSGSESKEEPWMVRPNDIINLPYDLCFEGRSGDRVPSVRTICIFKVLGRILSPYT